MLWMSVLGLVLELVTDFLHLEEVLADSVKQAKAVPSDWEPGRVADLE